MKVLLISENVPLAKALAANVPDGLIFYSCPGDALENLGSLDVAEIFMEERFSEDSVADIVRAIRESGAHIPIRILSEQRAYDPRELGLNVSFTSRETDDLVEKIRESIRKKPKKRRRK